MAKHHDYLCRMVKKSAGEDKEKYIKRIYQDVGTAKVRITPELSMNPFETITGKHASQVC